MKHILWGSVSGTAFWESVLKIGRSVPQLPRNSWPVYFPRGKWFPGTDGKPRDPADTSHVTGDMTDLKRELEQRIFTIEAMAYGLGVGLIDPFDGRQDLADQRIRCIGKPEDVWKAEEILSCVRLAVRLGYGIDKDTLDSAVAHKDRLIKVPGPWVGDEIIKMFSGNISDLVYQIRCAQPIFMEVLPELKPMVGFKQNNPYHAYDVWRHTLEALSVANGDLIVRLVVLFHDIGKIAVPDSVLLKNASLTREEYEIIKRHPGLGYHILSAISSYQEIAPIVLCHHERIDGRGYPNGITGDQIPEEAKMISVADAFDAMTSHRRYRENLTLEQAVSQLEQGKGTQFDQKIAEAFIEILKDYEAIREEIAWTFEETALDLEHR